MMRWRQWRRRLSALATVTLVVGMLAAINRAPAYGVTGQETDPPPFPTNCPPAQAPPPGYPNPPPSAATPYVYQGHAYHGPIPYEVPFKAIIFKGEISLPPNVDVPYLYASLCGLVQLPQLSGTVFGDNINLGYPDAQGRYDTANVFIAKLEALPANISFGTSPAKPALQSTIFAAAAPNGGLDITLNGTTVSSVSTLGMTCSLTINSTFTTKPVGHLPSQPVTGPTEAGQAEVVSNSFPVGAAVPSATCPAAIAQTFNKLLGLPAKAGAATFTAPFCFDFELQAVNNPANAPVKNPNCPWPKS